MELKEYIKIIKKKAKLILTIGVVVAVSALLFSVFKPIKYETSLSLFINKNKTQQTDDFKYDGYYALQAGEVIADSVQQWLKSPETVDAIYQKARIDPSFKNIKSYTKKFNAKKMSAQYVEVKFESDSKEEAGKISSAVAEVIKDKIKNLEENSEEELSFSIESENPIIVESKPNVFLNAIIGLVSGLFFGVFIAFGKEYFSSNSF